MNKFSYEDFVSAAEREGLLGSFSEADLQLARNRPEVGMSLLSYKIDYNNAPSDEARALANAGAERLRASYGGYTAGEAGSGYHLNGSREDGYVNQFAAQQQSLGERVAEGFDPTAAESLWGDYERLYQRQGEYAYRNSLAEAAANTGGIASTAAVTAAQQAQNSYAAQSAAKKAELYQQAYENYLAQRQSDMQAAELYDSLHRSEQAAEQQRYDNALALWQGYGYVTEEIAATIGLPTGTPWSEQAYNEWYQAFQEAKNGVYTGKTQYDGVNLGERETPTVADSAQAHKTVSMGSHSLDVQAMQRYLTQLGYPCATDGLFGGGTLAALRQFQKNAGLYPDGVCGPLTWTALIQSAQSLRQ